jgi:hypothetical protein
MRLPLRPERYQRQLGGPDPSTSASPGSFLDRSEDSRRELRWAAVIYEFEHGVKVVAPIARDPPCKLIDKAGCPESFCPPGHDRIMRDDERACAHAEFASGATSFLRRVERSKRRGKSRASSRAKPAIGPNANSKEVAPWAS